MARVMFSAVAKALDLVTGLTAGLSEDTVEYLHNDLFPGLLYR